MALLDLALCKLGTTEATGLSLDSETVEDVDGKVLIV